MKSGVRRTESGGIEFSKGVMQWVTALLVLLATAAGYGFTLYRAKDRIDHAVQQPEFDGTVRAIHAELADTTRAIRADLDNLDSAVRRTSADNLALSCFSTGYPSPFCDAVPRRAGNPVQAGRPRRSP